MAFVPGYEHDIFVSYAHVDDELVSSAEKGWVSLLVRNLQRNLDRQLGRPEDYELWMDDQLDHAARLTPQIEMKLRNSAILLVILSPGYLRSGWCAQERECFAAQFEDKNEADGRVFLVESDPVESQDRPHEFEELVGFRFWETGKRDNPIPLGWPAPSNEEKLYWHYLDDLSRALVGKLRTLRAKAMARAQATPPAADPGSQPATPAAVESDLASVPALPARPPSPPGTDGGPAVFLAHVTGDLDKRRDDLQRYLTQAGVRVLPERWCPQDPTALRKYLDRHLPHCKLFVQLLSEAVGERSADFPRGYAGAQVEAALAGGVPVLQWRDRELDLRTIQDPDHLRLLRQDTVCAMDWEEFKSEAKKRAFAQPVQVGGLPEAFVFVDTEGEDRPLADELGKEIVRHGAACVLPIERGEPSKIRLDLEQNLLFCDALIVVYGKTTAAWIRSRLRTAFKTIRQRPRDQPLRALAVYEGPPESKEELGMLHPSMRTLNCRRGLNERELTSLLACLRPGGRT